MLTKRERQISHRLLTLNGISALSKGQAAALLSVARDALISCDLGDGNGMSPKEVEQLRGAYEKIRQAFTFAYTE